jgi:hypothetical protein
MSILNSSRGESIEYGLSAFLLKDSKVLSDLVIEPQTKSPPLSMQKAGEFREKSMPT